MNIILLLASFISFQLPLAFYKDTVRRFQRMETYNPDKAFEYQYKNGNIKESRAIILYWLCALLSLVPLIGGFHINWFIAIIIVIIAIIYIIPFIAFFMYKSNAIYSKSSLKKIGIICVILGLILLAYGTGHY